MSYNSSAQVFVTNNTGGNANIHLVHRYSSDKPQSGSWSHVKPGAPAGPLSVGFNTGFIRTGMDYWWIGVEVLDGPNAGYYTSPGNADDPGKECMLESADNGKSLYFSVSIDILQMNLVSGACTTGMSKVTRSEAYNAKVSSEKVAHS